MIELKPNTMPSGMSYILESNTIPNIVDPCEANTIDYNLFWISGAMGFGMAIATGLSYLLVRSCRTDKTNDTVNTSQNVGSDILGSMPEHSYDGSSINPLH